VIGQLTGGVAYDFNNLSTAVVENIELAALRTRDQNVLNVLRSAGTAAERRGDVIPPGAGWFPVRRTP
jgi:hypothetical protein